MRIPPSLPRFDAAGKPLCLKLKRSIYGLSQASRCWSDIFTKFMLEYGFVRSSIDTCLFVYKHQEQTMHACVWVDDVVISDNSPKLRDHFVGALHNTFPLDDKGPLDWILGIQIKRDRRTRVLTMSQELYIQDVVAKHAAHLEGVSRHFDSPMSEDLAHISYDQQPPHGTPEWENMRDKHDTYMIVVGALL